MGWSFLRLPSRQLLNGSPSTQQKTPKDAQSHAIVVDEEARRLAPIYFLCLRNVQDQRSNVNKRTLGHYAKVIKTFAARVDRARSF
mmetsp:Transcript_7157/g.14944  ORF Transcript_7157/g.14944 Transcript_7157/m.14944 type:complete len:86 (+) Transcript_7157:710-967(+)